MKLISVIILLVGGITLTIGDLVMKRWVISSKPLLYVIGLSIYLIGLMFLAQNFKYKNIAIASLILVLFNIVTLSLVSWLVFKETLNTLQILGIVVGLIAVSIPELS